MTTPTSPLEPELESFIEDFVIPRRRADMRRLIKQYVTKECLEELKYISANSAEHTLLKVRRRIRELDKILSGEEYGEIIHNA